MTATLPYIVLSERWLLLHAALQFDQHKLLCHFGACSCQTITLFD